MGPLQAKHLRRALDWLSKYSIGQAKWVLFLAGLVTIISASYTVQNLGINTDTTDMLSPDMPFRQFQDEYNQKFPLYTQSLFLVIEANTPEMAHAVVTTLETRLKSDQDQIKSVYVPFGGPFFEKHSLLYLDFADLEKLADVLAESKPFIDELLQDPSLSGLFAMLEDSYKRTDWEKDSLLDSFFVRSAEAIQASLAGIDYTLSWHSVILDQNPSAAHTVRFLVVQPNLDFHRLLPAGPALQAIRRIIEDSHLTKIPGVRVRITGEVALAHEELLLVSQRAGIAAILALVMVCLTLLVGFHSLRLMAATLVMLLVGLVLSAAFATVAIGHLNIISVAFAVLFIGLGVDYAIHLCLRYRELLGLGDPAGQAMRQSIRDVGPSLILCAATTSIGFYAFVPTNYPGMSELGLISGTSLFIGLIVSLTVLPAMLTVFPLHQVKNSLSQGSSRFLAPLFTLPIRYGKGIRWGTIGLLFLSLFLLTRATFDHNPHNLRDPNSESVSTFRDLLDTREGAPWALTVLAKDEATGLDYSSRLSELETVDKVVTLQDFLPAQQFGKFLFLQEIASNFQTQPKNVGAQPVTSVERQTTALQSFLKTLNAHIAKKNGKGDQGSAIHLRNHIQELLRHLDGLEDEPKRELLDRIEQSLLGSIPPDPTNISPADRIGPVGLDDLPREVTEQWVSNDGTYRIQVVPKENLTDNRALRNFVNEVRSVAPQAIGLPVVYFEGGEEVVRAFQQAFSWAILGILAVLVLLLRNIRDTLLVVLPLCLAGILTGAATVAFNWPFNYANIIALPLILGLGADNGIHIVDRIRRMPARCEHFLQSSTMRGVFFSGLTTILSFSNLAYTPPLGIASMGLLLAVGVFFTLLCSLVIGQTPDSIDQ